MTDLNAKIKQAQQQREERVRAAKAERPALSRDLADLARKFPPKRQRRPIER